MHPILQPGEAAKIRTENILHAAMHDGVRVAQQHSTDDDDLALNVGLGSEFHISDHGDHVAAHLAVDVDVVTCVLPNTETTASSTRPALVDEPNTETTSSARASSASVAL